MTPTGNAQSPGQSRLPRYEIDLERVLWRSARCSHARAPRTSLLDRACMYVYCMPRAREGVLSPNLTGPRALPSREGGDPTTRRPVLRDQRGCHPYHQVGTGSMVQPRPQPQLAPSRRVVFRSSVCVGGSRAGVLFREGQAVRGPGLVRHPPRENNTLHDSATRTRRVAVPVMAGLVMAALVKG